MADIYLNVRKTNASHRRCTVPQCNIINNLRRISRAKRLSALKTNRVFIPNGARGCARHFSSENWIPGTQIENRFTRQQLDDMIGLLFEKTETYNSPGKLVA